MYSGDTTIILMNLHGETRNILIAIHYRIKHAKPIYINATYFNCKLFSKYVETGFKNKQKCCNYWYPFGLHIVGIQKQSLSLPPFFLKNQNKVRIKFLIARVKLQQEHLSLYFCNSYVITHYQNKIFAICHYDIV